MCGACSPGHTAGSSGALLTSILRSLKAIYTRLLPRALPPAPCPSLPATGKHTTARLLLLQHRPCVALEHCEHETDAADVHTVLQRPLHRRRSPVPAPHIRTERATFLHWRCRTVLSHSHTSPPHTNSAPPPLPVPPPSRTWAAGWGGCLVCRTAAGPGRTAAAGRRTPPSQPGRAAAPPAPPGSRAAGASGRERVVGCGVKWMEEYGGREWGGLESGREGAMPGQPCTCPCAPAPCPPPRPPPSSFQHRSSHPTLTHGSCPA